MTDVRRAEMPAVVRYSALLSYLGALYLAFGGGASEALRKTHDIEVNVSDGVTETHYASCKIATEEAVANARATVTRVLTGACKAKTMDEKFADLEAKLVKEFADIKWSLYSILERHSDCLKDTRRYANLYGKTSDGFLSPRQHEVDEFNNTVQNLFISNASAFVYYWRVRNFDGMLATWQTGRSARSPTFYAGPSGYAVYLKVTPKYFPDGTVFVSVGLTHGRYDSALAWPFPLKVRLEVLDHSPEGARDDRRSRIWDPATLCTDNFWGRPAGGTDNPECVGLSISRRVVLSKVFPTTHQRLHLRNTKYMWNGSILIKLTVYL